jgi:hypothetical protein
MALKEDLDVIRQILAIIGLSFNTQKKTTLYNDCDSLCDTETHTILQAYLQTTTILLPRTLQMSAVKTAVKTLKTFYFIVEYSFSWNVSVCSILYITRIPENKIFIA